MQKKWEIEKPLENDETKVVKAISAKYKCPLIIADLLYRKGNTTEDEINSFFNPTLEMLHDPFLFDDMEKAVTRILQAIDNGEKITIYGDYDVDGVTATALLYLGLKDLNATIDYYVPHRMIDGYGLSLSGLEQIHGTGTSLIISVDCGIFAIDEVEAINDMGMQIIITDHHNPKESIPPAYAVINPKLSDSSYPYPDLAGVGVAYKLLMAIYQKKGILSGDNITNFLDLVALGTIADIVPLTGENRALAIIGLKYLKKRNNIGLTALMKISEIGDRELEVNDINYCLAPRINAAGRMGSAMRAVELLITSDETKCSELAQIIEDENALRQQIDQKTFSEAIEMINKKYKNIKETQCLVISSDNWHYGVIGIVASKLVEKYHRPTILISLNEGVGSGSGRSVHNIDLFKGITETEDLLVSFGGHNHAVGLTILPEYIDIFEKRLSEYIKNNSDVQNQLPLLKINNKLHLYEISNILLDWLKKFEPHGQHNPVPVFYTENVMVHGYPYTVGKNHLRVKVSKDGCELDMIGYNLGDYLTLLKNKSNINIAFTVNYTTWQGKTSIQGNLKDIKIVDS